MCKKPVKASSDPFKDARLSGPVAECRFGGQPIPMLLRHNDVREAAKDWRTFSSDAPFRVPIPSEEAVRRVRQLPIETDPPDHGGYRALIEPFFNRPRQPEVREKITAIIHELLAAALRRESIECVHEFALPLQSRALACLLNVPDGEATQWIGWGINVLEDAGLSEEKGAALERYIERQLDRAEARPGDDFFSMLATVEFRGRRLTRDEMTGFANLVFAGGRDTVIHMISSVLAYVGNHPDVLPQLRENPRLIITATEEFLRHVSPLTHIGRVCPHPTDMHGAKVGANQSVSLCWASANRDETVFDEPDAVRLDRKPNPHIAFGSGAHTCVGALHARTLLRGLLTAVAERVAHISVLEAKEHLEEVACFNRQVGYDRLVLRFTGRQTDDTATSTS